MPLPVVEDVAKVVIKGHIGSHPMQNVIHCRITSPLDSAGAQTIGNLIGAALDGLAASMNESCGMDNLEFYDLATVGGPQFTILPSTWPFVGSLDNGALPPSTAAVVALRGTTGGRSGRGRLYLGGFDELASDGDSIAPDHFTLINAVAGDLIDDVSMVVVSYYSGTDKTQVNRRNVPIPRVTPLVTDLDTRVLRPRWGSQRRRADLV